MCEYCENIKASNALSKRFVEVASDANASPLVLMNALLATAHEVALANPALTGVSAVAAYRMYQFLSATAAQTHPQTNQTTH